MVRRKILMASPHYWGSTFQVGGHQLARALVAEGWDVAYVTTPISPLHLSQGLSRQLRDRWSIYRHGGVMDLDDHLWTYVPGSLISPVNVPILRSPFVHHHWERFTFPSVVRTVRRRGFGQPDVIYIDSVIQRFWLDALPHRRSVQRIADAMVGFPQFTPTMHALERRVAHEVDLVAYTAHSLEPHVTSLGPRRTMYLPNGVDVAHFERGDRSLPADLAPIPRPIAMYVGALDAWFDFEMLDRMAEQLPGVSFVLIGPDQHARARLAARPNVHLLGSRPYAALPGYLAHADVGLIPFDVVGHPELVNSIHPLKLYEYLLMGLPVVATRWQELESLDSPAVLCRTAAEFVSAISGVVAEPPNQDLGVAFARNASWRERARQLLAALE